ncbi:MAG: PorT family protein [Treponema sp.]|nr:PorT family protein [Treponema sp.]
MKKSILGLLCTVVCLFSVNAEMMWGIRGSVNGTASDFDDEAKESIRKALVQIGYSDVSIKNGSSVAGGGISAFFYWPIDSVPGLGFQIEPGFIFNNGYKMDINTKVSGVPVKGDVSVVYNSFELPFMVTYTFRRHKFVELIPRGGLYLSIPYNQKTKTNLSVPSTGYSISSTKTFEKSGIGHIGMILGFDVALNVSDKSAVLLGLHDLNDFTTLRDSDDAKIGRRSVFGITAGYRHTVE